jgi:arginine utilization protein RocB
MSRTRRKEAGPRLRLILPKSPEADRSREGARCASTPPKNVEDMIPYSARELKYLWTLWDEAQIHRRPGLRYRNIYAGAIGVVLTGWLIYGMGLSVSPLLGGILMLAGTLTGVWYSLKSLLQEGQFDPKR